MLEAYRSLTLTNFGQYYDVLDVAHLSDDEVEWQGLINQIILENYKMMQCLTSLSSWSVDMPVITKGLPELQSMTLKTVNMMKDFFERLYDQQFQQESLNKPSLLVRSWPTLVGSGLLLYGSLHQSYISVGDVITYANDAKITLQNFFLDWIYLPLLEIYDTIRHRERHLVIAGAQSLRTDMDVSLICL